MVIRDAYPWFGILTLESHQLHCDPIFTAGLIPNFHHRLSMVSPVA